MRFRVEGREIKQQDTMIGVQGDNQVETYEFDLPRVYNGLDLYGSGIAYIIFQPCGGEPGYVPINEQDRKLEGDRMILTWIVGNQVTQSEGFLKVALKISGLDAELWNSLPTRFIIGGTIQVDSPQPEVFAKSSLMLRTANPDMEPPITVTERKINIPAELQNIAVQNDENSEEVKIILPRFFDGNDLSQYTISLICKSDGGKSIVTFSPEVKSSEIHLLWMLKPPQTSYAGKLNLQLRVEDVYKRQA